MTILYSIIVPAYNEEALLPKSLSCLKKVMEGIEEKGELIVVDNNSNDRTAEIARESGAEVIFEAINQISRARNAGAKAARGNYFIFVDADTLLNQTLLRLALDNLLNGSCCGGGAEVSLEREVKWFPRTMLKLWNWNSRKRNIAAGCFMYALRDAFEAVGGFSESVYASEEIWFSRAMKIWGKKRKLRFQIISENPVITSVRKLEWYSPGSLMMFCLPILLFPPLLRVQYFCRPWYRRPDKSD